MMLPKLDRIALPPMPFWGLLVAFVLLFFMGGSSRGDVQSLAILNPAMIICCGAALLTLKREHWAGRKWLAGAVGVVFFLGVLYILPLPIHFAAYSQGLSNVEDIRAAARVYDAPQTLAIAPHAARQSLFFLFAPLAVILFAVQLDRHDLRTALPLIIVLGAISGIIGVVQLTGSASGPLYFYHITNNGSAVGLFANRNHAAVFLACLIPMLAIFAAKSRTAVRGGRNSKQWLAIAISALLAPLILVTGSRSGMFSGVFGLFGAALVYKTHAKFNSTSKSGASTALISVLLLVTCLVFVTIYFSRAEAIDRIFDERNDANNRIEFWTSSLQLFWQYFPFGYGPGGFVPAFQNDEALGLLNGTYLNRLHNDWLETALAFGSSSVIVMLASAALYLHRSFDLWMRMDGKRPSVAFGRMASIVIAILAVASVSDYPLQTSAMAGFGALVLVWFADARRDQKYPIKLVS